MADMPKFKPMPGATGFIHHVGEAPAYWMHHEPADDFGRI